MGIAAEASAGNFATCILDTMPAIQNDRAAFATLKACSSDYPKMFAGVEQGSGSRLFGYDNSWKCISDKAGNTHSKAAAYQIARACRWLYDDPPTQDFVPFNGKLDNER